MASIKISDLSSVTTLASSDVLPIVNGNDTKKVSISQLSDKIISDIGGTGFTPVIVQTLPTQDIDTHTIYLVPKTGETGDVYDEWIYINNAWEHIGSTSVDLSNYYTKSEIDTKYPIGPTTTKPIGQYSYVSSLFSYTTGYSRNIAVFSNNSDLETIINNMYRDGYTSCIITILPTDNNLSASPIFYPLFVTVNNIDFSSLKQSSQWIPFSLCTIDARNNTASSTGGDRNFVEYRQAYSQAEISYDSSTDTFYISNGVATVFQGENYRLAMTSYVDDAIAAIPSGGGSDIVNAIHYKDVSSTNNIIHVYRVRASINYSDLALQSTIQNIIIPVYNDCKEYFETGFNVIRIETAEYTNTMMEWVINWRGSNPTGWNDIYVSMYSPNFMGRTQIRFIPTYTDGEMSNMSNYVSSSTYDDLKALSVNNTKAYTPTSTYHPATKGYVDSLPTTYSGYDATKTQILKSINGTLTWVDE